MPTSRQLNRPSRHLVLLHETLPQMSPVSSPVSIPSARLHVVLRLLLVEGFVFAVLA
jgi:hypothetical protein